MISRVLQLNISQLESSFKQSFGEAPRAESSKPTQSKPNPICDRTVKLVEQENTSCSREIVGKCLQEELDSSDRTGKLVKREDNRVMQVPDRTGKPVESRTPHSARIWFCPNIVILHLRTRTSSILQLTRKTSTSTSQACRTRWVKRSHGINIHNLIQQIENHFQSDLQQHRAWNSFSEESKDAIKAAGNTELCEIVGRGAGNHNAEHA